ncbi:hypothetical protein [Streptomyces sp. NPDC014894]|uniref:hypothetical protein n=1 Tax=Streptomyces sp. NPDC014894 TaxID=3364931 RepID=UPI0036F58822
MAEPTEEETVRRFRERVSRGETDGIEIEHRVSGGTPGERRTSEEVTLTGTGSARARGEDSREPGGAGARDSAGSLEDAETRELFRRLGASTEGLVPRSETGFTPDSLVGSVTIRVDGHRATLFYLADPEQRETQGRPLPPETAEAVGAFARLARRMLNE